MCPEISSILCQSEATVGLSLQFPGERKNAFTLQEFQGALKLLVWLCCCHLRTFKGPPSAQGIGGSFYYCCLIHTETSQQGYTMRPVF